MVLTLYLRPKINWQQYREMTQEIIDKYPCPCEQCGKHTLQLYRKKPHEGMWRCFECNWKETPD